MRACYQFVYVSNLAIGAVCATVTEVPQEVHPASLLHGDADWNTFINPDESLVACDGYVFYCNIYIVDECVFFKTQTIVTDDRDVVGANGWETMMQHISEKWEVDSEAVAISKAYITEECRTRVHSNCYLRMRAKNWRSGIYNQISDFLKVLNLNCGIEKPFNGVNGVVTLYLNFVGTSFTVNVTYSVFCAYDNGGAIFKIERTLDVCSIANNTINSHCVTNRKIHRLSDMRSWQTEVDLSDWDFNQCLGADGNVGPYSVKREQSHRVVSDGCVCMINKSTAACFKCRDSFVPRTSVSKIDHVSDISALGWFPFYLCC